LAKLFQLDVAELRQELLSWHTHDWQSDPWSQGAYSYVLAGGLPQLPRLAEPVEDTLFFAGEHTDQEGHWGTVHAALCSGLRAAAQVLDGQRQPQSLDDLHIRE
jgi:monoamine oxidase